MAPSLVSVISGPKTFYIKSRKVLPGCCKWLFEQLYKTASKFWICFNRNSKPACIAYVFNTLNDVNPNFLKEIF